MTDNNQGGASGWLDGWRISGVQVEEEGTWKNTMTIDIECDDDEFERIRKNRTRISGMVYTYGLSQHPTQVGWFSFRADRDFDDDDDRDLEVVDRKLIPQLERAVRAALHDAPRLFAPGAPVITVHAQR